MSNAPLLSAEVALAKYPTSVTDVADGLMSQAVVRFTAVENGFTGLSRMLALFCVPPESTVTVREADLTALSEIVATFRGQTGMGRSRRADQRETSDNGGEGAESNRSTNTWKKE